MRTLVFIPAWNEEASIAAVIADVRERLPEADILVVDDGSTDATAARAREAAPSSPPCPSTRASGRRCRPATSTRCARATTSAPTSTPTASTRPRRSPACSPRSTADRADLVIGSRYRDPGAVAASDDYRPTFSRRIGTSVFRFFLTLATRQRFTDTTSGMRAANRRVMALFSEHYSPDFAEIESLQLAVRQGLRVEEVPVRMLERAGGSSFLTPLRSAFFIFKGLVVLLVGQFRPAPGGGGAMSVLPLAAGEAQVHLTSQTRIVAAVIAIFFMLLILELIRRDRLQERYSVIWFVAGLGMLAGAAFPGLLELVADVMGVRDTNVALFSIVLLLLLGLALNFSVIMSRQAAQITRLAQERALEKARRKQAGRGRNGNGSAGEQRLEPEEKRLEG